MRCPLPWHRCDSTARGDDAKQAQPSVYIIAEIGVNHDGDIDKAKQLIDAAQRAGADAVKFQIFNAAELAGDDAPLCTYQADAIEAATSQRDMLAKLELSSAQLTSLRQYAAKCNIDFIATPFGLDELHFLANSLKPTAIKIASPDLVNISLIDAAIETHLPLIISTGASTQDEIDACVARIANAEATERTALLHCISAYPTPLAAAQLGTIRFLAECCNLTVGFSDHTTSIETGAYAVCAGAPILERHLTYDCNAVGPDHAMSTEPDDFRRYVTAARAAAAAMTGGPRTTSEIELEVRKLARGRLILASDLPAGTRLQPQHLRVQRPADGICPSRWDDVIGQTLTTPLLQGTPLDWKHLQTAAVSV